MGRQIPRRRVHHYVKVSRTKSPPPQANSIPAATSRAVSAERNRSNTFNPKGIAKPGPLPVTTFPSVTTPSADISASGKCSSKPG